MARRPDRLAKVRALAGDGKGWQRVREFNADFICLCGGHGKHGAAITRDGKVFYLVGFTCLRFFGLEQAKVVRQTAMTAEQVKAAIGITVVKTAPVATAPVAVVAK